MVFLGLLHHLRHVKCGYFSRNGGCGRNSRAHTSQISGFWLAYAPSSLVRRHLPVAPPNISSSRRRPMSEHIHHVTDDTFEPEVLQAAMPVLVDYWAAGSGPSN